MVVADIGDDGDLAAVPAQAGAQDAAARRLQHGHFHSGCCKTAWALRGPLQSPFTRSTPSK